MIKSTAKNILRALPDEGRFLITSVRKLQVRKELAMLNFGHRSDIAAIPDPRTLYWIDPFRIDLHTSFKTNDPDWEGWVFPQRGRVEIIQDGDWDISELKVADMRICRAVDARVNHNASWESTDYYQTALHQIVAGNPLWGCTDRASFDQRCAEIDKLIESIAKDGYKDSKQLGITQIDSALGHQEITINISRDGLPLFQDGRHRLAIARALRIKKIPVQILVRHSEWQNFRDFIQGLANGSDSDEKSGYLDQDPVHFDLQSIPFSSECQDIWEAITPHLPEDTGLALDLGCNLGYFCHGLEKTGFSVVGVENSPEAAYAAKKIAAAEGKEFHVIAGDILSNSIQSEICKDEFAVVLVLNSFQQVLKTPSGLNQLENFIRNLRCRAMIFEPHHADDPQMKDGDFNTTPHEFTRMVAAWGHFRSIDPIYKAEDGRTIYLLKR